MMPFAEASYEKLFKQVTKLEEGNIIKKTNCKFCMHPARADAELEWEKSNRGGVMRVMKFFQDYRKEHPESPAMSSPNLRNHLFNHYSKQEQKMWLQEYSGRLMDFMNYKLGKDQMFEALSATMQMHLFDIASDPTIDSCHTYVSL